MVSKPRTVSVRSWSSTPAKFGGNEFDSPRSGENLAYGVKAVYDVERVSHAGSFWGLYAIGVRLNHAPADLHRFVEPFAELLQVRLCSLWR